MPRTIEFTIEHGNIATFNADVVALKYAQSFYGADRIVADALGSKGVSINSLQLLPDEYTYLDTRGATAAPHALFVGVPALRNFDYRDIRQFTARVLTVLNREAPQTQHLAMTIHGANFGLDEVEALLAQFSVCLTAAETAAVPSQLEKITIVEIFAKRVQNLQFALANTLAGKPYAIQCGTRPLFRLPVGPRPTAPQAEELYRATTESRAPGAKSESKPHAFVAMPFSDGMIDVFNYGIQQAVRAAGFVCERIDQSNFVGDIFAEIKKKIDVANLLVADLTGARPNVYLEVGYAMGKGVPTILLVKDVNDLEFDLQGQRCLVYKNITELEKLLTQELAGLRANGCIQ